MNRDLSAKNSVLFVKYAIIREERNFIRKVFDFIRKSKINIK